MSTTTNAILTDKIAKMMDDQNKMLKRMGTHLTRLEESRFKRPIGEKEDEEMEDWDEKDKAKYEKNKKFEKLIMDTLAIKEKMEKMQKIYPKDGWLCL